jgi:spermidine synthase
MCTKQSSLAKVTMAQDGRGWRAASVMSGAITAGTQVILLREVISTFLGNELVIGIILFDWLALTGVGALITGRLAGRLRVSLIPPVVIAALSILPPLTIFTFRVLPLLVAPVGSMLEIHIFLVGSMLVLGPVCIASGGAFALLIRASATRQRSTPVGTVYAWEGLGSLLGGVLFGVVLFDLVTSWDLLLALCVCAGVAAALIAFATKEPLAGVLLVVIAAALLSTRYFVDGDKWALEVRYPEHNILAHEETPFGILTATRSGEQTTVFVNNVPVLVGGDIQSNEEVVHLTLAQRRSPGRVLIVGGDPSGLVPEVLKYPGARVVCIEENSWMREVERMYLPVPSDERVEYSVGDLRSHLNGLMESYDAMILVVPEPASLQSNRMYTRELLELAHRTLTKSGVLCVSLPSSEDYAGDDARTVRATLRNTLRTAFTNVRVLPVGRDVFLASDSTLRIDCAAAITEAGVNTIYANAGYIQDDLLAVRIQRLDAALQRATPVNSDNHPVLMLAQIRYWLRFFTADSWLPALLFVALLLVTIRPDRVSFGVMSAGCGGIVLELMIIMIVQVGFGNVYKVVGGFVGLYMAGMSFGAYLGGRLRCEARTYGVAQCGLGVAVLSLPFLQSILPSSSLPVVIGLVACLFLGSLCAGIVFALTARVREQDPVLSGSRLYAVDLLGSAMGALFIGPFVFPLLGAQATANLATGVVIGGALVTLTSPVWRAYEKA